MDNKKKNGLIRLLGRLGRRVRILRKPLTVLVVLGVSIRHLFRKLFFDVNYHAARMRVLLGATCLAFLLTLFVIPAIADEMIDLTTETEYIDSEEEATPTPLPEEVTAPDGQEGTEPDTGENPGSDPDATDGTGGTGEAGDATPAPENADPSVNPSDGSGDGSGETGNDMDVTVNPDGTETITNEDGVTYTVDENGRPVSDEDAEVMETNGIAVRVKNDAPKPDDAFLSSVSVTSTVTSCQFDENFVLTANPTRHYQAGDNMGNGCTFESSTFEYIWAVSEYGKSESNPITTDWSSTEQLTLDYNNFYGKADRFYGVDKEYVFTCRVREKINYSFHGGTGTIYTKEKDPRVQSPNIRITKRKITVPSVAGSPNGDLIYPSPMNVAAVDAKAQDSGNVYAAPTLKKSASDYGGTYPSGRPFHGTDNIKFAYKFVPQSGMPSGAKPITVSEDGKTYYFDIEDLNVETAKYDIYVEIVAGGDYYEVDDPATGKEIFVNYEQDESVEKVKEKLTVSSVPAQPVDGDWVKSLTIQVGGSYKMKTDLSSKYDSKYEVSEGTTGVCPEKLVFSKSGNRIKGSLGTSDIEEKYGHTYPVKVDKTGPWIDNFGFVESEVDPDSHVKKTDDGKYYINGDFKITGKLLDKQQAGTSEEDGSGVEGAKYRLMITGGTSGTWQDLTIDGSGQFTELVTFPDGADASKGGYLEIEATDKVGNKSTDNNAFIKENNTAKYKITFEMKDTEPPKFTLLDTGTEITGIGEDAAHPAVIYIADGREAYVQIADDKSGITVNDVTTSHGTYMPDMSADNKLIYKFDQGDIDDFSITATDRAGNARTVYFQILDPGSTYEADTSEMLIPEAEYGFNPDETFFRAKMFVNALASDESIEIKSWKVDGGDFVIDSVSTGTGEFTVRPKAGLHVKGVTNWADVANTTASYTAMVDINYVLYKTESGVPSVIKDQHVVRRPVTFKVKPRALTLTYNGSTEYYHTREYERNAEAWFEDHITVNGFAAGEGVADLGKVPALKHDGAADEFKVTSDEALTTDGYVIANGELSFTLGQNIQAAADGNENSFDYYYKENTGSPCRGSVTTERREIGEGEGYTITSVSDYNEEDGGPGGSGHVGGNTSWYVEDMELKSVTGKYKLLDTTVVTGSPGDYEYTDGADGLDLEAGDTDSGGSGTDSIGSHLFEDRTDKFYDPQDGKAVIKFYYVLNVETREISKTMKVEIRIDTTNPGWDGGTEPTLGLVRFEKPDGDGDDYHPYFHIETNIWRKFLNMASSHMFFNDIMDIKVENNVDKQSGPNTTYYSIIPKEYDTEKDLEKDLDVEWEEFSGDAPISEDKEKSGYVYIKITNGAGLNCFLRSEPFIIFDSKGPTIYIDQEGETHLDDTTHVVQDKEDFIANKVKIRVYDEQALFGTVIDKNGQVIPAVDSKGERIPAVKVYKGTRISMDAQIYASYVAPIDDNNNPAKEITFDLDRFDDDYYTIVAKDNSGMNTTRVFKVSTPVYNIDVNTLEFDTETYGKPLDQMKDVVWKKTGNATPDIKNVEATDGFAAVKDESGEWAIVPPENPKAGVHEGDVIVTFADNQEVTGNATKTAKGRCKLTVRKKLLVAEYRGCTIYRGQKVTNQDVLIDDSQFEYGDTKSVITTWPTVTVPEYPSETMIITPKGGMADNYRFDDASNVGGVVTVLTDKATKGTHFVVEGTMSDTGWYTSNIVLKPKTGYALSLDPTGNSATGEIKIYDDTNAGEQKFYVKDTGTSGEHVGEVFEQSVFSYKKDTVSPKIEGVTDGQTYTANTQQVTVSDNYLYRVTVNGTMKEIKDGKAVFNLIPDQQETVFFITAEDYAGHITTSTVTLKQLDGANDDVDLADNPSYNPEDDIIQDDTEDGDGSYLGTLTRKVLLVDGAPTTTFTSSNAVLRSSVLTAAERAVMKEGSDVLIKLRVQNIDGTVSQRDKETVIAALGDYSVGQYLDITLWKTVGSGAEKQVTSVGSPISMTITIPETLRNTSKKKKRQFAIVRIHNGTAVVLQDSDRSANTITVSSSKFSVYALAYRDVDASKLTSGSDDNGSGGGGSGGGGSGGSGGGGGGGAETDGIINNAPQTGDKAPLIPTAIGFGAALIGMITVIIIRRRMDYEWVYVDEDGNIIEEDTEQS